MVVWKHLIRFVAEDGLIYAGDAMLPEANSDIGKLAEAGSLHAHLITATTNNSFIDMFFL